MPRRSCQVSTNHNLWICIVSKYGGLYRHTRAWYKLFAHKSSGMGTMQSITTLQRLFLTHAQLRLLLCLSVCLLPRFLPPRARNRPKSDSNWFFNRWLCTAFKCYGMKSEQAKVQITTGLPRPYSACLHSERSYHGGRVSSLMMPKTLSNLGQTLRELSRDHNTSNYWQRGFW